MILWMSDTREGLPIAHRIQQEGYEIYTYIHDPTCRRSHGGLLENKIGIGGLRTALKKCDVVIFDMNVVNFKKPHDLALLQFFGVSTGVKDVFGPISEKLKKSHKVVGGTRFAAMIEFQRDKGIELARKCGFSIPRYEMVHSCKEGVKFLESTEGHKHLWVIKPEGQKDLDWTYIETYEGEAIDILKHNLPSQYGDKLDLLIQEKIEGVELSTAVRWNGHEFVGFSRTFERKKLADGNLSCSTGSQSNEVYMCDKMEGVVFDEMKKLKPYLEVSGAVICIDANCIINESGNWFLEWTPREGFSSTYLELSFLPDGQVANYFVNGFKALYRPGVVSSEVVSLWPYPAPEQRLLNQKVKDNLINHRLQDLSNFWMQDVYKDDAGSLRCVGTDGFVGVMACHGDDLDDSVNKLYRKIEKLRVTGNLQYRTKRDHLEQINKRLSKLKSWGIGVF